MGAVIGGLYAMGYSADTLEKIIEEGSFATDEIVNMLLKKAIENPKHHNKIIFDGYPRNISQAINLIKILDTANQAIEVILFLPFLEKFNLEMHQLCCPDISDQIFLGNIKNN